MYVRMNIESVVDKNTGKSSGGLKDEMCTFCMMSVVWMQNQLKQNQTEEKIMNYVNEVKSFGLIISSFSRERK